MSRSNYLTKTIMIVLLFTFCFSVCSCSEESKGTYIDGTYMNDKLNVGYIFYTDGKGLQFISKDHFPIEYEITEGMITITTLLDDTSITKSFPFEQNGDNIVIDGVTYVAVPDDVSDTSFD